ncbi:hypothetical protein ACVI1J_006464 [Bradyrhizobium diazoefficiens]
MAKTVEEQLEETLTSISTVEQNGQRYTIKDRGAPICANLISVRSASKSRQRARSAAAFAPSG